MVCASLLTKQYPNSKSLQGMGLRLVNPGFRPACMASFSSMPASAQTNTGGGVYESVSDGYKRKTRPNLDNLLASCDSDGRVQQARKTTPAKRPPRAELTLKHDRTLC